MTARWTAPDIAGLRGDNTRPLQKIFASLTEYLQGLVENSRVLQTYVRNAETTTLEIGEVVYLHERQGDRATVKRASNTSDATSAKTLGVVAERIAPNADGLVTTQGYVYHMNLSAFTAGETVYLSNVAGGITATKPVAPNHLVYVGVVVRANAGNGILYARAQNGYELDEIHDVLISSPTQGQVLSYNASTSLWQNSTFSDGGGLTNLNASNLASGTVPSARVSGSYSGITGVGTLTGLTIGGAGANRSITINAPSGYYAIQYFAINGTNEWHYEVTPSGSSWSLVESGVAARLTMTNTTLTVAGGVTASSRIHAQTDLRVGNTNSAVLSSDAYRLTVTPQAYTGYPVSLGEFYASAGVGGVIGPLRVYGTTSVTITSATNSVWGTFDANEFRVTRSSYSGVVFNCGARVEGAYSGWYLANRNTGSGEYALYADANTLRIYGSGPGDWMSFERAGNLWIRFSQWMIPTANNVQWVGGIPAFGSNALGGCGAYNFYNPSDERYKKNKKPLSLGMSFLRRLNPISFTYLYPEFANTDDHSDPSALVPVSITEGQRLRAGFSAQEVKQAMDAEGFGDYNFWSLADKDQPDSMQALDYTGFVAPIVKAIQELDSRLSLLETA